MIQFTTVSTPIELEGILSLQAKNLPINISSEEAKEQGFVTVKHDMPLLSAMNQPYPHIIAKKNDQVVGYALVMLPAFGNAVPVLRPMFEKIDTLHFKNKPLIATNYFVMGQVCVDKTCRRQGVFSGLYQQMKEEMSSQFDCIITEVATRNIRSMNAHRHVGFEVVDTYTVAAEEWAIVVWDWTKPVL